MPLRGAPDLQAIRRPEPLLCLRQRVLSALASPSASLRSAMGRARTATRLPHWIPGGSITSARPAAAGPGGASISSPELSRPVRDPETPIEDGLAVVL